MDIRLKKLQVEPHTYRKDPADSPGLLAINNFYVRTRLQFKVRHSVRVTTPTSTEEVEQLMCDEHTTLVYTNMLFRC